MLVFNTELHIITFLIIMLELIFLCHQIIYYLSRPSDKNRLYFLILLYLLVQHNLVGGLLPDPKIPISIFTQNIMAYGVAFAMGMYFPYYFYKAYKLEKMRFYAIWGNFLFLLGPFLLLFLIPYYFTGNLTFSRKLAVIVPFLYTISFLYSLRSAIKAKRLETTPTSKTDIVGMYVAVILFGLLPVKGFFETNLNEWLKPILHFHNGSQVVEILTTNSGLLVMTILFIRQTVLQARTEYQQLLTSERQLQELNSELMIKVKERTKELELVNEQKTNVFINLAHETKTPLTLISTYLEEYIKRNNLSENTELKLLGKAIGNLRKDIVNFFDMEKIQKGISLYNHNYISDFSKLITEGVALFQVSAARKGIKIIKNIEDDVLVKADPSSLCRIMNNLIENAIKYTPEEGIIEVRLTIVNDDINFSVKDDGMGIPKDHQSKIFDPYYQVNSEKRNFQGIGMGLSIVKKIIEELKGDIYIVSDPPKEIGTKITVRLDAYQKKDDDFIMDFTDDTAILYEVEKLGLSEQLTNTNKSTILIVEDNVRLLTLMVETLREEYNVHFASCGEEAIEKLKLLSKLDLIVSDVMMDNGNGFFLYKYILSQKNLKHIPLIFVTAKITKEDRIEGLSLGAVDYICKPFSMDELMIRVNSLLKTIGNQRSAIITNAYNSLMSATTELNGDPNSEQNNKSKSFEKNCQKYNITNREIDVIKLVAKGKINKEIANELNIANHTVKKHLQNTFEKVGVNNKIELLKKLEGD